MELDHVTVAGRDLARLERAVADAGLPATAGGDHDNGVTHMATVPFRDGVYLELIASRDLKRTAPWWDAAIRADAGPCAWAIRSDDIAADVTRLRDRGLAVSDPETFRRVRPDGVELAWDLAVVGEEHPDRSAPGGLCPFLVSDHTPRDSRVGDPLDPATSDVPATGVAEVVVGVSDLGAGVATLRDGFALDAPERGDDATFGRVAHFSDAPVSLASGPDWIDARVDRFGPMPCAFLLDVEADDCGGGESARPWFGRTLRPIEGLSTQWRVLTVE